MARLIPQPLHEIVAQWVEVRTLPCACGGWVIANRIDPTYGVQRHQMTSRHREWSAKTYN